MVERTLGRRSAAPVQSTELDLTSRFVAHGVTL